MGHHTPNDDVPYEQIRAEVKYPTVSDILSIYKFTRYEYRTLLTVDGRLTQASMLVQNPSDINDRYIVTAKFDGEPEWSVQCPRHKYFMASLIIEAVRSRIAVVRSLRKACTEHYPDAELKAA